VAANNFLTDDIILKSSLRLLVNETVMAPLVYRDHERRFGKVGDTISLELPYRTKTAEGPTLQVQPMVDRKTPFKINRHRHFGIEFTQKDRRLSIQQFTDRYLRSGITQMANEIDRSICLTLKSAFFSTGLPGTTPGNFLAFAGSGAFQTAVAVPNDGRRRAVLNPITCAVLSDQMKGLNNSKGLDKVVPKGYRSEVYDYSLHETQNLPVHTVGNYVGSTPQVNGANQTGNSLVTNGWAAGQTVLNAGDVFKVDSCYAINPQNYENSGYLQCFVAQADVVADGAGNAVIPLAPSINDGTLTMTNDQGEVVSLRAYQNVTNAPADGATISVIGASDTTYQQNYLFHREAIGFAMIDFELPETAVIKKRVRDPKSGMSMCMTGSYDVQNFRSIYRVDSLWGAHMIYPELALRLWGASPEQLA
jgi:hypothetical protein